MTRLLSVWTPLVAGLMVAANASAYEGMLRMPAEQGAAPAARLSTDSRNSLAAYFDHEGAEAKEPGCEAPLCGSEASCACEASCGCEPSCGCDSGCCGYSSCGGGWGCCLMGDCCLGEAWTLQSYLHPCCDSPTYGGWFSAGYYNNLERLSRERGDRLSFNDSPDEFGLDQAWFYTEKLAQADCCSADWGYRFDILYGRQAHAAQAFGNPTGSWDLSFNHGRYEWAMPQAYLEVAYGDWSYKIGHWFTVAGYEVVQATGNFFYSHALTHYNSEPFTHTGVLGTYSGIDDITVYAGWALGWDTGFDQYDGGNIFIGGFTYDKIQDVSLTFITTVGNFGWKSEGEFGYSHHFVGVFDLSDNLQWVVAHDYLNTDGIPDDANTRGEDKSLVNYLFYTLNDCWKLGGRAEWWKSDNVIPGQATSFYEISGGLNYQATANLVIRPEIRYDWVPAEDAYRNEFGESYNQTWFGIDAVLTY